ncbi:hypothetical protein KM043_018206 [Ampulex compressa]|nr:hypothetical protein KM043_018206 [Ampulex compressa]
MDVDAKRSSMPLEDAWPRFPLGPLPRRWHNDEFEAPGTKFAADGSCRMQRSIRQRRILRKTAALGTR